MEYTFLNKDKIDYIKDFLDPEVYEDFFTGDDRYAIVASDIGAVRGVVVFDAKKIIRIVDIAVTEECRGILEKHLIRTLLNVVSELDYSGLVMDIYDSEHQDNVVLALNNEGFYETEKKILYRFSMKDLFTNPYIKKAKGSSEVCFLDEVGDAEKKLFSNKLIQNGLFENFLSEDISKELSTVWLRDGKIQGCVLINELDDRSFYVEYVYVEEGEGAFVLPALLSVAADSLYDRYTDVEADGFILSTDDKTNEMILKVLPGADRVDCCRTYAC